MSTDEQLQQLPQLPPGGRTADHVFVAATISGTPTPANPDALSVSLSNSALISADLTSLPEATTSLSLAANALPTLSLSPLTTTPLLTALILNGNALTSLSLSALANTRLERLWLHNNALTSLDLSPLSTVPTLRSLYLDANALPSLDLSPLASCPALRALRLARNPLSTLDITPVLHCSSLSTLVTSPSVTLTARTLAAVPAPLPPALRRRAALVSWTAAAVAPDPVPTENILPPRRPCRRPQAHLTESPSLEELADLCRKPLPPGTYGVAIVGFRRNARFAIEKLLELHGGMTTAVVASPLATQATSLEAVGALEMCGVFLVRVEAKELVRSLREKDGDVPIVVVGGEGEADKAGACVKAGATLALKEPLGPRDALIIRHLAQERNLRKKPRPDTPTVKVLDSSVGVGGSAGCGGNVQTFSRSSTVTETQAPTLLVLGRRPVEPSAAAVEAARYRRRSGPGAQNIIDFARLRRRSSGQGANTNNRSSRVEESAIGMLFSRCGGRALPADFSAIATLCGIPVCATKLLHAASRAWSVANGGEQVCLSPVSIADFGRSSGWANRDSGKDFTEGEGISYECFRGFWLEHMKNRDGEARLFNVLCVAHNGEGTVPVAAITEVATALVSKRSSAEMEKEDMSALAASILCYEIKGTGWNWIRRQELSRCKLSHALLAAETGMFDGVATNLRADRMADLGTAFAAAQGRRTLNGANLSVKDVAWLCSERGLLSRRAVVAVFDRANLPHDQGMSMAAFAPMWLAISKPSSRSAVEYLFSILDADMDGYVSSADVAHFYAEKRNVLCNDGYVPTAFEHVWNSLLDSVGLGRSARRVVGIPAIRKLNAKARTTFFQSLLFLEDGEMAMVDLCSTADSGSIAAKHAVSAA